MLSDIKSMLSDVKTMPSAKTLVTTAASVAASAMVVRSIARDLVPYEVQHYFYSKVHGFLKSFSSEVVIIIEEYDGLICNRIYKAAEIYLGSKVSLSTQMFKVMMPEKETKLSTSMAKNQAITDTYSGVQFKWRKVTIEHDRPKQVMYQGPYSKATRSEVRYFELRFHKKHKEIVFDSYFPFVLKESQSVKEEGKTLKIHTLNSDDMGRYSGASKAWCSINLDHPATFETLALDTELKKMIMEDLERFVKRKDLYRRVGKAWKRGYLLYGPPGTGKSSLVAAMANYLKFDIYDLELSNIRSDSELRRLLIATANRCIIVVEDIDCSLDLEDRKADERVAKILQSNHVRQAQTINIFRQQKQDRVSLSGLLNFIDGLWSSCGDERIIVFTTNHKDKLDPALLRPGRMDVHIHMSYCSPCGFKTLAANYLGITEHPLFAEIEELLVEKAMVTPAEVGEQLLKRDDTESALQGLIEFIIDKKREYEEKEARKPKQEEDGEEAETKNAEEEGQSVGTEKAN